MSKGSKEIKESTKKLGKIIINPLSDSYNKIKETNAQMSRIRKEHKLDLESYDSAYNNLQKTLENQIPKVEFAELRDISHWGENFVAFVEKTQKWAEKQTGKIKKFAKTHPLIISILIIYFAPHILVGSIALGPAIPMMASGTGMTLFAVAPILVPRSLARFVLERLIIKAPSVIYKFKRTELN